VPSLNPDDYITSTHRGHGHLIAKGGEKHGYDGLNYMVKRQAICQGKGGSMPVANTDSSDVGCQ